MEPRIPNGSFCLFASPVTGTRQGKIVLAMLRDTVDPETDQRFTVKRYESEKVSSGDGSWRHLRVTLHPENPDFEPIELAADDEEQVIVLAEFVGGGVVRIEERVKPRGCPSIIFLWFGVDLSDVLRIRDAERWANWAV
jgi:hypothetical protein